MKSVVPSGTKDADMKFMVCYDDSASAKEALKEAQIHASRWNAELVVASIVTRIEPIKHEKLLKMEKKLEQEIEELFAEVEIPYTVQLYVDEAEAGERIVKIAQRNEVALIFLGIRKRSKVGKLLFGSTAQYVILNAPCPVVSINKA